MTQASSLLELQGLDLEILRSKKRLDELPEKRAILTVRAKVRDVTALHAKADMLVRKLDNDLTAHQDEISMLSAKIEVEQNKVMETKDHRAATSITREMDGLKRRRDKVEMESLALMERIDKAKGQIATIDNALAQLAAQEAMLVKQFQTVGGELQTLIAEDEARRTDLAAAIDSDLIKTYEAARESKGGVGVGRLDGETCTACRMVLPAERVRELSNGPEIAVCPQCRRLIVILPGDDE